MFPPCQIPVQSILFTWWDGNFLGRIDSDISMITCLIKVQKIYTVLCGTFVSHSAFYYSDVNKITQSEEKNGLIVTPDCIMSFSTDVSHTLKPGFKYE